MFELVLGPQERERLEAKSSLLMEDLFVWVWSDIMNDLPSPSGSDLPNLVLQSNLIPGATVFPPGSLKLSLLVFSIIISMSRNKRRLSALSSGK